MPATDEAAGIVVAAGFPPAARVRAKAEFSRVFEAGKRVADPLLALHRLDDGDAPRLGLAVSRKVDPTAVGRNRIKRVLRDAFRHQRPRLAPGAYVVVARAQAAATDNHGLREAFLRLLERAGALPVPSPAGTMPPPACSKAPPSPEAPRPAPAEPACR